MNQNIYNYASGAQWKDENFDVASYRDTGASPPDIITIPTTNIITVSFDGASTVEDIDACKELNHDYREGTPIYFHVHWYATTSAAGNVKWQIEYYITKWDVVTPVKGTISVVAAASGVAWQPQITSFGALDLGALAEIGSQIHFRFFRDPTDVADTYGADAAVGTVGYHYQTNSRGSAAISAK